jgi:hypothetical protein
MTEFQNPKQLAFDIEIWNLFVIWCLLFPVYPDLGLYRTLSSNMLQGNYHNPKLGPCK